MLNITKGIYLREGELRILLNFSLLYFIFAMTGVEGGLEFVIIVSLK